MLRFVQKNLPKHLSKRFTTRASSTATQYAPLEVPPASEIFRNSQKQQEEAGFFIIFNFLINLAKKKNVFWQFCNHETFFFIQQKLIFQIKKNSRPHKSLALEYRPPDSAGFLFFFFKFSFYFSFFLILMNKSIII